MISITKIKIFDSYNGDLDRFERVGLGSEKKLLGKNDWSLIENFYQDIELINKILVTPTIGQ